jgi:ribosomal protein S26
MKLKFYQTKFSQAGAWQTLSLRPVLGLFVFLLLAPSATLRAQAELICDGTTQTLVASGAAEEFVIPFDPTIAQIELIAHGADGGFADLGNGCFAEGGAGATARAIFELGDGDGAIPYGSTIRFVVGVAGEKGTGGTVLGTGNTYGGGGGGTGMLLKKPGSDQWDVIVVAGGGGGAYQGSVIGICVDNKTGQGGRAGTSGGDGNGANGGKGGQVGSGGMAGGVDGFEVTGGGGGAYTKGEGITCVDLNGSDEVAEGQQGFPNGGAGGGNEGCIGSTFRDGGFGFGGGASGQGGGAGGGGFSGGGGGGSAGRGGGGGSYIVPEAVDAIIEEGEISAITEDGFAQYRCIKRTDPVDETPTASCVGDVLPVALNADGSISITPSLISADTLDPSLIYSLSAVEFSCDSLGERAVTLTVTNSQDQSDSCFTIIMIVDDLQPEVNCPPSAEVSCDADYTAATLGEATATDNCSTPELEMSEVITEGDCPGEQTITRSWTATDASGNSSSCEQVIVVSDNTAPVCDNCPENLSVNCVTMPEVPQVTFSDNCDADPSVSLDISSTQTAEGCAAYSYEETRTWTATDVCGNTSTFTQVVKVKDEEAPQCLNCPADITVSCDAVPAAPSLEVSDNCDPAPTVQLSISSTQTDEGCAAAGYVETRTWTISDVCGNTATHVQIVTVTDEEAPQCLNCPADITVSCDAVPAAPSLEVSDNCDPAPTVQLSISSTQTDEGCAAAGYVETRTWTISDACGNTATHVQIVTVTDEEAPQCLNCPADITVSCDAVPAAPSLEVSDNCDPNPTVELNIISTQTSSGCSAHSYVETRSWTITDACGNTTTHEQVITVEDMTAPEISCPPAITVTCDNSPELTGIPGIMDNCDPAPDYDFEDLVLSGNCDWDCLMERTWTATDACGNTSTCVQTIEQSVLELLEDALSADTDGDALADPLTIGRLTRHSLTVTAEGAECLLGWLPDTGGKAWPLIRTDFLADGSDCTPEGLPLDAAGKMNNPLVSGTLLLGIKLRLDPSLGDILLSDLDCSFHPIVFQGLPRNPDIADLYQQVNLVVGNIIGLPFVEHYADVLSCINGTYGLCPESSSTDLIGAAGLPGTRVAQAEAQIRLFPNPVRDQLRVDLAPFAGQNGQLRLINTVGQTVLERQIQDIPTEPISIATGQLSSGLYVLQVRIGEQVVNRQFVVQD